MIQQIKYDSVKADEEDIFAMGQEIKTIVPDADNIYQRNLPTIASMGKLKKAYAYGAYREVVVENYSMGVLIKNTATGLYEWFCAARRNEAFTKAQKMSARYKKVSRMF
jgi:hypothetical protein